MLKGNIFLLFMYLGYIGAITSSQVASAKTNVFVLNAMRYTVQVAIGIVIVIVTKDSLYVTWRHAGLMVASFSGNILYVSVFYFAATFMPIGNLDALFCAMYCITATLYDVMRKVVNKVTIAASAIAILGIVLLAQPWKHEFKEPRLKMIPCDYLDGDYDPSIFNTSSTMGNDTDYSTTSMTPTENHHRRMTTIYGYMCIAMAAIGMTIHGNVNKYLYNHEYKVGCILFWQGIAGCLTSHSILVILSVTTHHSYYTYPTGCWCIIFSALFGLSSLFGYIFANFAYPYLSISELAVANTFITIILYVVQRTVLSAFHSGNANTVEVLGIVIILFCILSTCFSRCVQGK